MARFTVSTQHERDEQMRRLSLRGLHVKAQSAPGGFEILWCLPEYLRDSAARMTGTDRFFMSLPLSHPANAV